MSAKEHIEKWGFVKPDSLDEKFYSEKDMISFAESYAKELKHHKETTVGLYAFDKPIELIKVSGPEFDEYNYKTPMEIFDYSFFHKFDEAQEQGYELCSEIFRDKTNTGRNTYSCIMKRAKQ